MERIIVGPLKASQVRTLIIIDALDECKDKEPASAILSVLSHYVDEIPNVKFFITGRPEPRIRSGFRLQSLVPITEILKLHEVKPEAVNSDIKLFFRMQLTHLAKNRSDCDLTEDWPSSSDIKILCKKAAGFFIYASTVVKFVASDNDSPTESLALITSLPQSTAEEGKSGIDQLYTKVLEQAFCGIHSDNSQRYLCFRAVVGTIVLIFNPLSIKGLSDLLKLQTSHIHSTLRSLHSLLLVPDGTEDPILTFHKSFPDFLTDPERCKNIRFLVESTVHHAEILLSCLELMRERLKRNICNLDDHAIISDLKNLSAHCKVHIGDALKYACQFWTKHLLKIPSSASCIKEVEEGINQFFTTCLPYWIEVLALTGNLGAGVYAISDVEKWCTSVSAVQNWLLDPMLTLIQAGVICQWTTDSQRLILEHFDTICDSPSYIYNFALPISPPLSWLHWCYSIEPSQEIRVVKGVSVAWGKCFRTVWFSSYPRCLICWKDTIAVGLHSGSIIILNAITGIQVAILSGHTHYVRSLVFLPGGASLVSGSCDSTIKLWDMQTGGVIKTFQGHTSMVASVSISADCTTIASGSLDKTIRLWDIQTGECHHIIGQNHFVNYVCFSPLDPKHLMSISGNKVWQWGISGQQIAPEYDGSCITFSSDSTLFAMCNGSAVEVQSSASKGTVAKFHTAKEEIQCCCFSPDNRVVAIAADSIVYVWDITGSDPHLLETFIGHAYIIVSLVFSSPSSLISASADHSVKFWQIDGLSTDPVPADQKSTPFASAPVKSVTLQAKDGIAISNHSDGVVKIWGVSTGLCKASFQTPVKDPQQIDTRVTDGRLVSVWCIDKKICIWDTEKGELLRTLDAPVGGIMDLRISGDGSKVFCLHGYLYCPNIQALSIQTREIVGEVEPELIPSTDLLTIDDQRVWVHSPPPDDKIKGWDFGILGSSPVKLVDTS